MVFCNTRRMTDVIHNVIKHNGVKSAPIHGGLTQSNRLKTIEQFNKGKVRVLVCTDVAARGLHIEGVSHVYNYDMPKDPDDYVHRIGRTARAGKEGLVINLLAPRDQKNFSKLRSSYREFTIKKEELPGLEMLGKDFVDKGGLDTTNGPKSRGYKAKGYKSKSHRSSGGNYGRKKPSFGKSNSSNFKPER